MFHLFIHISPLMMASTNYSIANFISFSSAAAPQPSPAPQLLLQFLQSLLFQDPSPTPPWVRQAESTNEVRGPWWGAALTSRTASLGRDRAAGKAPRDLLVQNLYAKVTQIPPRGHQPHSSRCYFQWDPGISHHLSAFALSTTPSTWC